MAYYKSIIAYDGTDFHGFQRQAEGIRTIQGVFEDTLSRLGWKEFSIKAAGRTDAGVHARGQVVSYQLNWRESPNLLTVALNSLLPKDVAVRETAESDEGFHPRRSARSRQYDYQLWLSESPDPFMEHFSWRIWPIPDLALMQRAAAELVGFMDFASFGRAPVEGGHTLREVHRAKFVEGHDFLIFTIEANAFLYHMVRRILAALVDLGLGRIDFNEWNTLCQGSENRWQGRIAPARGLFLERVTYE